ncbi:DegT/DnrJ/EryC1/StrS family aminotransferase [Rhodobaculum claviforme]|nr:DegT/DnrJ/EryC1/StrS family aminotransferase [Rhodobaculum claviforme]
MADDQGFPPNLSRAQEAAPPPADPAPRAPVPVFRPLLPCVERLLPYLRRIDATRLYSNRGPLVEELEGRLADLIAVPPHGLRLAASGTLALMLAILAHAGRGVAEGARPVALMPAFTFVATAQAAEMCGWRPVFADVDPVRWTLDPDAVRAHPDFGRAGLIVAAAPYGILPDIAGLARLQAETGVPVVVDAAAGFEALCDAPGTVSDTVPMALSFHATKSFSTAEGGAVAWGCASGQRRVMQIANFGFFGTRAARTIGLNAKMSDYHAAVGLAMLDDLAARRAAQAHVADSYARAAQGRVAGRLHLPPRISPAYALYEATDAGACARAEAALHADAIESRRWYGHGVHREPWFADTQAPEAKAEAAGVLPVTCRLCDRLLGLPTAPDLDLASIAWIVAALARAEAEGRAR